jgi:ParB family chromosome partitioning protein
MQDSSAFQYIAIDTIHESATNPRVTFDPARLEELAASIRQHGLIQPITVRPNAAGFEIVAGARRFRAAQMAELFSVPVHIVEIDDAHALELALAENVLRADVHPYEEAAGLRRLLDMPGYDVATLADKFGKSASHIYARLSLLQLIPEVAEAFTQDRIAASHANLIARLPQESQAAAFEQCWRKDWNDKEPHLLPAKNLAAWIQTHLYLALEDAPFDREDATLNPAAGACLTCPRRSGYNTLLFADVEIHGDQCLDSHCYQIKVANFLDRAIAARPELLQIEDDWRRAKEQRPGAVHRGHFREIESENPDAEPPCAAAKPAIVVYGKRLGAMLTVCTDDDCPVHDPRAARRHTAEPAPVTEPAGDDQTAVGAEAEEPDREAQASREEYDAERERKAEERRQELARRQQEYEAEQARREELSKARAGQLDRILAHAPATFSAAQLRVFLRALLSLDPFTLIDDLAAHFAGDDEDDQRCAEEVLLTTLGGLSEDQITGFALRLAFSGHTAIPREGEIDFLAEAEAALVTPEPREPAGAKKAKAPIEAAPTTTPKKKAARKKVAA